MGHVWLQVLPREKDDRLVLQEAVMRRRLEKYPADFLALYSLGALEEAQGKTDDALAMYEAALRIEPNSATARNSLAAALLTKGDTSRASAEWRGVLAADPGYLNARYNLARALAGLGDLDGPAREYRMFLEARPEDAQAQAGLGTVLYKQRDFAHALDCFRKAAALAPSDRADKLWHAARDRRRSTECRKGICARAAGRSLTRSSTRQSGASQGAIGIGRSALIIQGTPKRSRHIPKRLAQKVSCIGIKVWPSSLNKAKMPSASSVELTTRER